ncbi:MAG TPA: hypothetical protein VLF61_01015, partial [Rhabdochlamydiaceae bacterium]|nr:hypothetical protein [Rhabdochlamydiaceae bacterium]
VLEVQILKKWAEGNAAYQKDPIGYARYLVNMMNERNAKGKRDDTLDAVALYFKQKHQIPDDSSDTVVPKDPIETKSDETWTDAQVERLQKIEDGLDRLIEHLHGVQDLVQKGTPEYREVQNLINWVETGADYQKDPIGYARYLVNMMNERNARGEKDAVRDAMTLYFKQKHNL